MISRPGPPLGPRTVGIALAVLAVHVSQPFRGLAQDDCRLHLQAGPRPHVDRTTVADGSPLSETEAGGLAVGLGIACPVGGPFLAGPSLEVSSGHPLALYHVLATGSLELTKLVGGGGRTGGVTVSLEGSLGWTLSSLTPDDHLLIGPGIAIALDPGTSGPALGAGLRLGLPLAGGFRAFLRGAWRTSFLSMTEFGDARGAAGTVAFEVLPVTAGVALRL